MHVTAAVLRAGVSYARQKESSSCLVSAFETCRPVHPSNGASLLLLWPETPSAAPRLHRGVAVLEATFRKPWRRQQLNVKDEQETAEQEPKTCHILWLLAFLFHGCLFDLPRKAYGALGLRSCVLILFGFWMPQALEGSCGARADGAGGSPNVPFSKLSL